MYPSTATDITAPGQYLQQLLAAQGMRLPVQWRQQTVSTSEDARQAASQQQWQGLFLADIQTAGRGQQGRSWIGQAGQLYLSWLTPLSRPLQGQLGLLMAVRLAQRMATLCQPAGTAPQPYRIGIKWPNDLIACWPQVHGIDKLGNQDGEEQHDGASNQVSGEHWGKWGGLLLEPAGHQQLIVGVGINRVIQDWPSTNSLFQPVALQDLLAPGKSLPDLPELAVMVSLTLQQALQQWQAGVTDWAAIFAEADLLAGRQLVLQMGEQQLTGTSCGIDQQGALQLDTAAGRLSCPAGRIVQVAGRPLSQAISRTT